MGALRGRTIADLDLATHVPSRPVTTPAVYVLLDHCPLLIIVEYFRETGFCCQDYGKRRAFAKAKLQKKQTPYPPAAGQRQTAGQGVQLPNSFLQFRIVD